MKGWVRVISIPSSSSSSLLWLFWLLPPPDTVCCCSRWEEELEVVGTCSTDAEFKSR